MKNHLTSTFLLLKLFLFFSFSAFSQTTWTVPGTYSTIAAAVTAINSGGVPAGGLTINVSAGHTETSVNISLNTTTSSAVNPILIQKSGGGANPLIQSSSAGSGSSISNDCFFKIFKTDYVTIDGIDLLENYTGTTTTPAIEFGYFITKQNNDACNYITIRNCNISLSLNASNTIGIYQSCIHGTTGAAVSVNNVGGQCNYNSYYANTIENAYYGISLNGFNATTYPDLNCSIGVGGGNTVTDFGISSFTTPIRAYWQRHITIANNTVSGGLGSSSTIYGISITGANNSNADVYNNTVTLLNSGYTKGIYLTSGSLTGGATNTINIYNNTITGCVNGALSAEFGGIIHETTATTANIYGNTISNNASGQLLYCISSAASSNNLNIYNNVVSDCTATDNFFGVSRAYYTSLAFDGNMNFYNNETYNITSYNSTFELCLFTGSFGTTGVQNFYNNRFYNITQNSSYGSGVYFIGMTLPYGEDVYCYNNMISGFTIGAGSTCESVYGIRSFNNYSLGNNYIAYNTVALNVTGNSPNFTSSALYINSTNTRVINNIFSNKSNHLGTGKTCAIEKSSSMTLSEYESINNNNCLYAGTGSANYLFFDGTTGYSTLAAFQSLVSPADANSISIDPSAYFTSTNDVHISLCSGCPLENAGTVYAAVSTDYDYEARSASAPEIGADEIVLILPVVLSNFAASSLQTFVQLSWETQSEINNDHFVIERSSDAKTFTEIGSVLGAGNTSSATIYTFTDENPEAGMNFYRLRQVDANGQYTFSKIENAYIQPTSLCTLLENPVLEHIQIRIISHENTPVQILLTDLNGKIYISEIAGKSGFSEVLSFPAQHFPNGVYILQCIIGEQHTTFKVVKQ